MNTWTKQTLGSIIVAAWASGLIYYVVPGDDQKYVFGALLFLAYLLGVRLPTPQAQATRSRLKSWLTGARLIRSYYKCS
jgi:hypothetical protein